MNFDLDYIEQLVKMVSDSELTELTLEKEDSAIVIRKEKEVVHAQTVVPQAIAAPAVSPVATGQVVCIIEAMKLMNEIESEVSGKVTQICVKDGEAVEYGQVLMYVE